MPVIHLVRHGQASFGADDYDKLSDLGSEQAEVVGEVLARRGLRDPVVVSGTLNRQRDTAAVVMGTAGIAGEPRNDARWNEYDLMDLLERYPAPTGSAPETTQELQRLLDPALEAWIDDLEADDWRSFSAGAAEALADLRTQSPGRDAVVVTSGGVMAAVCGALLSAPAAGIVALNRVAVNGAISTLIAGGAGVSLLTFNDHAHFTGERRSMLTYR
jgi:broad specificity phosphatase PhoE